MQVDERQKLREIIIDHVEYKPHPYTDRDGTLKIGLAHDLVNRGISLNASLYLLDEDIHYYESKLMSHLKFFTNLSPARKMILMTICHMIGLQNLLRLSELMLSIEGGNYVHASCILNNLGYDKLATIMITDTI